MRKYLLFDVGCLACSELAQTIEKNSRSQLEARSLSDPQMQQYLSSAKKEGHWEPTLLEVDGQQCRAYTGIALRAKLFFILGPNEAWKVLQKLYHVVEQKQESLVARRRFLAKSAILIGGVVFGLGLKKSPASAASAHSATTQGATCTLLSPASAHQYLDTSPSFQDAVARLGEPDWNMIYVYQSGSEKGIAAYYPSKKAILFVDDPKPGIETTALLLGVTSQSQGSTTFSWSTRRGELIATQVFQNGKSTVIPAIQSLSVQPNFNFQCFTRCLGANVSLVCAQSCVGCLLGNIILCAPCTICAGITGVSCARQCNF